MKTKLRYLLLPLFLSLAACAAPGTQPQAADTLSVAAKSGTINDGSAHVYAFLGTLHAPLFDRSINSAVSFLVNGENVGGINPNECMFIELPPGSYNLGWLGRTPSSPVTTSPMTLNIAANQNVFVALDIRSGDGVNYGVFFGAAGAIGGAMASANNDSGAFVVNRSSDGIQTIQNMKIVLPDKAIVEKIRPMGR